MSRFTRFARLYGVSVILLCGIVIIGWAAVEIAQCIAERINDMWAAR